MDNGYSGSVGSKRNAIAFPAYLCQDFVALEKRGEHVRRLI